MNFFGLNRVLNLLTYNKLQYHFDNGQNKTRC